MKLTNSIGWCDASTNAATGCDKISPGCTHCYASVGTRARVLRAQGIETWGPNGLRHPVNFEPTFRRLNKLCVCDNCHEVAPFIAAGSVCGRRDIGALDDDDCCQGILRRIRLFADSNSDWLDPKWPIETLAKFLDAIRLAPNIDTLLLTKRIESFNKRMTAVMDERCKAKYDTPDYLFEFVENWSEDNKPPSHVWIGVSAENQKYAGERIPKLLKTPAAVRFVSAEPLLENVNFKHVGNENSACNVLTGKQGWLTTSNHLDWVIVGGESGKDRRDCGVESVVNIAHQCVGAGVPVYVTQDCAFKSGQQGRIPDETWNLKQFPKL